MNDEFHHSAPTSSIPSIPAVGPGAQAGTLYGIGVGPGDSGLVTVAGAQIIATADVVAFHAGPHGRSTARRIAEPYLRHDGTQIEELLTYPVTTGSTDHAGGYEGALGQFYAEAAERLGTHLRNGRSVAVLSLGDPLVYSSYQHLHRLLGEDFPAHIIPGVTSFTASAALIGRPLVEKDETLSIISGILPQAEIESRLRHSDGAVIMKLGRTFPTVYQALVETGCDVRAYVVIRATMSNQKVVTLKEATQMDIPYFAVVVVPSLHDENLRSSSHTMQRRFSEG